MPMISGTFIVELLRNVRGIGEEPGGLPRRSWSLLVHRGQIVLALVGHSGNHSWDGHDPTDVLALPRRRSGWMFMDEVVAASDLEPVQLATETQVDFCFHESTTYHFGISLPGTQGAGPRMLCTSGIL
jgi:hypothetical protein